MTIHLALKGILIYITWLSDDIWWHILPEYVHFFTAAWVRQIRSFLLDYQSRIISWTNSCQVIVIGSRESQTFLCFAFDLHFHLKIHIVFQYFIRKFTNLQWVEESVWPLEKVFYMKFTIFQSLKWPPSYRWKFTSFQMLIWPRSSNEGLHFLQLLISHSNKSLRVYLGVKNNLWPLIKSLSHNIKWKFTFFHLHTWPPSNKSLNYYNSVKRSHISVSVA